MKTRTGGWQSQFTRTKTSILQFVEFTARSAELTVAEQRFCIRQVESCISRCSRDQFGIDRRSFPELAGGDMRCCSGVADVRSEYRLIGTRRNATHECNSLVDDRTRHDVVVGALE